MENEVLLGNVMVDCKDEKRLQSFYAELLGWERCTLYDRPGVRSTSGTVFLFIEEADYIPPVWPEENGRQQKRCSLFPGRRRRSGGRKSRSAGRRQD